MKKPAENFLQASIRLQYESQYWTGYNPKLVETIGEEAKDAAKLIDDLCTELIDYKRGHRERLVRTAIVGICLSLTIGFCVCSGTYWKDAYKIAYTNAKKELMREFENGAYERLGFQKMTIGDTNYSKYVIYVRRME